MRVAGRAHPVWSGRSVVYAADDGLCVRCVHGVSYAGTSHGSGVQRWDWSVANRISADICDPERNTGKSTTETSKKVADARLGAFILPQLIVYLCTLHAAGVFLCNKTRTD